MRDAGGEDEKRVEREREDEHVERGVVASAHAVANPRAVVVEPVYSTHEQEHETRVLGRQKVEVRAKWRQYWSGEIVVINNKYCIIYKEVLTILEVLENTHKREDSTYS